MKKNANGNVTFCMMDGIVTQFAFYIRDSNIAYCNATMPNSFFVKLQGFHLENVWIDVIKNEQMQNSVDESEMDEIMHTLH